LDNSPERIGHEPFVLTSTFLLDPIANVSEPAAMTIPVGLASGKPQEAFSGLRDGHGPRVLHPALCTRHPHPEHSARSAAQG
jgi:hypothetical protein